METTKCNYCGSIFQWDFYVWIGLGMPDCPACGYNNQTRSFGKQEGPQERRYRQMAQATAKKYGPLKSVQYLSHFPTFEINFIFEKALVYSGPRQPRYDINFLSLGYHGEGPRYARVFLDELGFSLTHDEIASIKPGAVLELQDGKVVVSYRPINELLNTPEARSQAAREINQRNSQGKRKWWEFWS